MTKPSDLKARAEAVWKQLNSNVQPSNVPLDFMLGVDVIHALLLTVQQEEREACALVAESWDDSLNDINAGIGMLHILNSGVPWQPGVTITAVEEPQPHEKWKADILGESYEVCRKEERRTVAAAIRARGDHE